MRDFPSGRPFPLWLTASLALDVLVLDQLTKWVVQKKLAMDAVVAVLPFFNLTLVHNTGASFGMFQDYNRAFIVVTVVILAFLASVHRRLAAEGRLTAVGLSLVWGGALGNLVDRARHGSVVDFLDFHWGVHHWPAFNVADSAITVGVALMFLQNLSRAGNQNPPR